MNDCIGCGYCCTKAPCLLARRIHGAGVTECPELIWEQNRHWCRLPRVQPHYIYDLHIGAGCCSPLNSWRREPLISRLSKPMAEVSVQAEFQDFLHCLGREWVSSDLLELVCLSFTGRLISRGYSPADATAYARRVKGYLYENRSRMAKEMMG